MSDPSTQIHRFILLLAIVLAPLPLHAKDVLPREEVDRLVKPVIDGQWVKGLAIGLLSGGDQQFIGYGSKSARDLAPPDEQTVFEIGSITKTFTATLLAEAVQRGEVALDEPVQKLLPEGVKMPAGPSGAAISLLHLTTHSSGLPRMPSNFAPADPADPYADYSVKQLYDYLGILQLQREPGEKCVYSNVGVALLGHVLALRAGKRYEELLVTRICDPLGLSGTRTSPDEAMQRQLAPAYDADGNPLKNWHMNAFAGAGGIYSNTHDMLRYLSAEMGLLPIDLSAAMRLTQKRQREFSKGTDIGLGWLIDQKDGYHWHNGQTGGYHCCVAFDVEKKVGVVVLCNSPGGIPDAIAHRLMRRLLGKKIVPLKLRQTKAVDPAVLARYVGEYKLGLLSWITLKQTNAGLTARLTGQSAYRIYPETETEFFWKVVDAHATFETDAGGRVTALVLHQNGADTRTEKTK